MRIPYSNGLIIILLLCTYLLESIHAQPEIIHFNRFTDEEGLPNNLFKKIIQDRDGLIWMAGLDGLARYDGFAIDTFRHDRADSNSLSGNNITDIYEDTKGRLWLATLGSGLNISDRNKAKFSLVKFLKDQQYIHPERVSDIAEDSLNRIWLATATGLVILTEKNESFVSATFEETTGVNPDSAGIQSVHLLFTDVKGNIWIGTSSGMFRYNPSDHRLYTPLDFKGLPATNIIDINYDRNRNLWISCDNNGPRLFYTSAQSNFFEAFHGIDFKSSTSDITFTFDLDNRLWVTVFNSQAYAYDFRDSTLFFQSKLHSEVAHERFFRKPFVDHSGNTWLPVEGFYIYPYPKGFNSYQHPYTFHQSNSCIYGVDSILWLGYREMGLVRLNKTNGITTFYSKEQTDKLHIPVNHIQSFFKVRSGNAIIVGFGNVAVMDPHDRIIASHPVNGTNRAGFEDSNGRIWIGGFQGLHLFSEKKGVIKTYKIIGRDQRQVIQKILEDEVGNIWFASDIQGLCMLDPVSEKITQYLPVEGDPNSLPSLSVLDMAIDTRNILWLATDVALVRFDPHTGEFTSYGRSDGLQNDYISAVICANDGKIWVSTHSGISCFDPDKKLFVNYGTADGLSNVSYYTRGKFYDKDGTIYFGGKKGVDYFRPEMLRRNPSAPIMYLSGVTVNNQRKYGNHDLDPTDGIVKLLPSDKLLEIDFIGLNYAHPEIIEYEYQMEGLSEDWIKLGRQRQVFFPALRPGDYVFRARAITSDGVMSEKNLILPIHVAPKFYQTTWFRASGIGLLLLAVFSFIKIRERNLKEKQQREAEVSRKLAELEKRALQAQMNPHFIYNSMNSIQQFMILHDIEGAMKYLTKFSRILRAVLTISSQSRIPLYDEIKLIEDYLELENMRFPNKFSYTIDVSPDINIHTVEIPPFFIQPQVENAIRHGLLRKAAPGHLKIEMKTRDGNLQINVEDDGIGREAARLAKNNSGSIEASKGLSIVEERLAHLHFDHVYQPFKIIDLYDHNQRPAGTRVEITLPLD